MSSHAPLITETAHPKTTNTTATVSLPGYRYGLRQLSAVALVVITGFYTHYAHQQAEAARNTLEQIIKQYPQIEISATAARDSAIQAKNANITTNEALIKVQRAFIFPAGSPEPAINGVGSSQSVIFYLRWENSGTTPTRNFRTHTSYYYQSQPLSDRFTFPDLWIDGQPHVNTAAVVGPRGNVATPLGPIPAVIMKAVANHQLHLYFWGWASYDDVFDKTPHHITKFCYEFVPIESTTLSGDLATMKYRIENWRHNNCYDDECKNKK
jgi:hypothetical protein